MHMLRHNDIPEYLKVIPRTHRFKRPLKEFPLLPSSQIWLSPITTERDEMRVPRHMIADQAFLHESSLQSEIA